MERFRRADAKIGDEDYWVWDGVDRREGLRSQVYFMKATCCNIDSYSKLNGFNEVVASDDRVLRETVGRKQ
jgi:hypothetical protein